MAREDGTRIAVLGLGNVLMGDDALGPTVIANLIAAYEPASGVTFEDLGTPGLDLHPYLTGCETVILVDVVRSDGAPGALRLYRKDEILRHAPPARTNPHDPGVKEALLSLEFAGGAPEEVLLVGVIPAGVGYEVGLSDQVSAAVPEAVSAVLDELARLGCPVQARVEPAAPELWWEAKS